MFLYSLKNKYQILPKTIKASLWFTVCFVIQRGLQFIGMPIFTRIMSIEDYGVYSVFLSWFNLICVFTSLSIYNGVFNRAYIKYESKRDSYVSSVQYLTVIVSVIFSIVMLLCHNLISDLTGFDLKFQLLMCVNVIFFPTFQYWAQKQRFIFEYKTLVWLTLLNSFLNLIIGILFVLISEEKALALVSVTVFVQSTINIVLFFNLAKKGNCGFDREFWHWSLLMALPLIPHYLSETLLGHADRIMINSMCGPTQAGIYNIVYQISMFMTIIRTGINGSYIPWLYLMLNSKNYESIKIVTNYIILIMMCLTFFIMLIGPEILRFVAPDSYYEAVVDIPAIMCGGYFIFIYVLFVNIEIYYEQTRFVAIASCLAAFLNIVLNMYSIPIWGYLSAGYTTMISYILMAIFHFYFLLKMKNKYNDMNEIFDMKTIAYSSLMLFILCLVSLLLYKIAIVRWVCILLLLYFFYCKRKLIVFFIDTIQNRNL